MEPELPVTATDATNEQAQNSPSIAVDPTDGRFVALASRIDGREFSCALHVSGDGGRTWYPSRPFPALPPGADRCYAPEIAFDGRGNLHYLFIGLHGSGNTPMGVFLSTSSNRGPFSEPRRVLGPDRFMVRMALDRGVGDQGRIHLVWVEASQPPPVGGFPLGRNPILASHSNDSGRSWSDPVAVGDSRRQLVVAPSIALGRDGGVHVAYYDLLDDRRDYQGLEGPVWEGEWSVIVSSSTDGGKSFSIHVEAGAGVRPTERVMLIFTMPPPAVAADRHGGVWVAWPDARSGDWDVLASASANGGRSFGAPIRVNDDPEANGRNQYLPRLVSSSRGRVDAIFYDRREDATNLSNHVFHAASTDGGRTFGPSIRVTSESSYTRTGISYLVPSAQGLIEFGSRLGLAPSKGGLVAAWTDTRNVRFGSTHQDVFATQIVLGESRSSGRGPVGLVVAGGLGATALAGLAVVRLRRTRFRRGATG